MFGGSYIELAAKFLMHVSDQVQPAKQVSCGWTEMPPQHPKRPNQAAKWRQHFRASDTHDIFRALPC
jgi:hypothetical protein